MAQQNTGPIRDSTGGDGFPFVDTRLTIAGRPWTITAVQNQDALLESVQTEADLAAFPYGLLLWASAIGLAERLASEPELVWKKRVLELGAGAGLPGLVARALGATRVVQTDYQDDALDLARRNARQNGVVGAEHRVADWRQFPPDLLSAFDVVLASDVLYERTLHAPLAGLLPRLLAPGAASGGLILLADPLRPQALDFLDARERDGWRAARLEGRRVRVPGDDASGQEIALFFVDGNGMRTGRRGATETT